MDICEFISPASSVAFFLEDDAGSVFSAAPAAGESLSILIFFMAIVAAPKKCVGSGILLLSTTKR